MKISAILLAAGLSERMGRDKLLLEYNGKSFLQHSIEILSDLHVYERIIVTTAARSESVTLPPNIKVLINPQPETGISKSVMICVNAAKGTHYLFLNADMPKLTTADINALIEAAKANPDKIIFPVVDFEPTSPTLFPVSFRTELLNLSGDNGGRKIRDAYPELNLAIVPDSPENFHDINTEEEYLGIF